MDPGIQLVLDFTIYDLAMTLFIHAPWVGCHVGVCIYLVYLFGICIWLYVTRSSYTAMPLSCWTAFHEWISIDMFQSLGTLWHLELPLASWNIQLKAWIPLNSCSDDFYMYVFYFEWYK